MAAFLPDNLAEIFLNSDSEDEFEGFDLQDLEEVEPPVVFDNFIVADWRRGDRPEPELEFRATPGLRLGTDLGDGEFLDYFKLFFKDQDFETMAEETNRYAKQYLDANHGNVKEKSRFKAWVCRRDNDEDQDGGDHNTETTVSEMKVFVAMILAMGLTNQQAFSEYWTVDEVTETPFYRKPMSRDRAERLMSFFHLANNAEAVARGQPGHRPLYKLGTL